ncbi:nucleotidyltransferase family protein [Acinetobacter sp. NIPH1876]|uniref:nucleotidyltransferase family protein n=1 Tax=Acinetobacter sp. NIPH1876 TaxID=2924041 RepID=UPI001FADEC2B|nr:nucleotidyltransferase family protein [Acinetobacter sp. NIPH1876]MCJ0830391.1 nucleotidyltransferase family protein [Acinetobacter sp. NIPH1876]
MYVLSRGNTETEQSNRSRLFDLIMQSPALYEMLQQLAQLHPTAYLSAGVLRNTVWAHLHGQSFDLQNSDVDVIYHDATERDHSREKQLQQALARIFPEQQWDVVNQALVHTWYGQDKAEKIQPLVSIEQALSLWPDTATALAVRLNRSGELELIAPFGLHDLFELRLRWNPALVSNDTFKQRVESKQWLQQWTKLQLVDDA